MTTTTLPARATRGVPATRRPQSVGTAVRDVRTMVARETRRQLRSVDGLVTALVLPVAIMLVFVVIFGGAISGGSGDYIDYVVPGVLVMCLGFGSATAATAVAQDMTSGTIDRFKTLPIFGPSALWGHVLASVARNLVSACTVVLVAVALGFRPDAGPLGWVGVVGFAVLAVLAFTWLSAALGLVLSVDASQSVNMLFLFVPYLSSGFVPVDTMPTWLHGFAEHQPFTPIIETLRGLLSGSGDGATAAAATAWLAGTLIVSTTAGSILYHHRTAR
ncbi:ABC transporter permease [Cellulosimicrobium arenosum]|uniref:Transport permease protein n=1 Tax=Cellulosimicrobium arenosum TaxID=2708133 RepID=A0A927IZZ9_9MICO|nr:ABC transporter permease [Cellulosimicrobium arenosum]MBD8078983.1 ABC transporter permease [Cellulosimicrobium arenosum]